MTVHVLLNLTNEIVLLFFFFCYLCFIVILISRDVRFSTTWYVRPAKAQTSPHIHTVWSEPLLVA